MTLPGWGAVIAITSGGLLPYAIRWAREYVERFKQSTSVAVSPEMFHRAVKRWSRQ